MPRHYANSAAPSEDDLRLGLEFSDGRRGCVALERLGPPWRGGYVWVVHATICQAGALPIERADIDAVFNALQMRVYDPTGNLRSSG